MQIFRATFWCATPSEAAQAGGKAKFEKESYYVLGAQVLAHLVTHAVTGTSWQALHHEAPPPPAGKSPGKGGGKGGGKRRKRKAKAEDVRKVDPFTVFVGDAKALKRAKKGIYLVEDGANETIRRWMAREETGLESGEREDEYQGSHWSIERVSARSVVEDLKPRKLVKLLKSNVVGCD